MFRPADPTKRRPAWLQSYTKENIIWQIIMIPVAMLLLEAYDRYADRRFTKQFEKQFPNT